MSCAHALVATLGYFRLIFCLMIVLSAGGVLAQKLSSQIHNSKRELAHVGERIGLNDQQRRTLSLEIGLLQADRTKINDLLISTAKRFRQLEQKITQIQDKLQLLVLQESDIRLSLNERRALLAEILAILQRMGQNPPPAMLVHRKDVLSSIRSAILLGSIVPDIRTEAKILFDDLGELTLIRARMSEHNKILSANLMKLAEEDARLSLILDKKKRLENQAHILLSRKRAVAIKLAAKERDLGKFIQSLEKEMASLNHQQVANTISKISKIPVLTDRTKLNSESISADPFSNHSRLQPSIAFSRAKGLLPKPVNGIEVQKFGEFDGFGSPSKGIKFATKINSIVVSPADGWVVYAGKFRSYGQIVIINTGDKHHILLAGMELNGVQLGQFVLTGEPIGKMGARRLASATVLGTESTHPILYVEFRKNENSIDPSPWWADDE